MKVIKYVKYGDANVLKQAEMEMPVVGANDILIQIHASSISAGDWRMRKADPYLVRIFNGLLAPKRVQVLGFELSGVVAQVGNSVTKFSVGDEVMASTGFKFGAYSEYIRMNQDDIIVKAPKNIKLTEAAGIPVGSMTALHYLHKGGKIYPGQKVLIYGASGSVGTYAIQIAKSYGAEVTAVCSGKNAELVRSIGADVVLDYNAPDFNLNSNSYDLIFDAVGKINKRIAKHALKLNARYTTVTNGTAKLNLESLELIRQLVEYNKLVPVIDKVFPISNVVEGHLYVEQQHKRGNVILKVKDQF